MPITGGVLMGGGAREGDSSSNPLEVTLALPVCHRLVVGVLLGVEEVRVVLDDVLAECVAGEGARLEFAGGVAQARRDSRVLACRVEIAAGHRRRLGLARDAVEARSERRRESEVR